MILQDWSAISQIVAAASAALIGLLFVAIQLNRDWIVPDPILRGRASETLLIFVLPLVASILLAIPGQPVRLLGAEILVLGAIFGLADIGANISGRRKATGPRTRLARVLNYTNPGITITVLTLISGAILTSGRVNGLYCLLAAMLLALIGGVATAWVFLMSGTDVDGNGAG